MTLRVGGTLLRAQQRAANTKAAVNSVVKALDQQIKRYKSHAYRSERNRLAERAATEEPEASYANGTGAGNAVPAEGAGLYVLERRSSMTISASSLTQ